MSVGDALSSTWLMEVWEGGQRTHMVGTHRLSVNLRSHTFSWNLLLLPSKYSGSHGSKEHPLKRQSLGHCTAISLGCWRGHVCSQRLWRCDSGLVCSAFLSFYHLYKRVSSSAYSSLYRPGYGWKEKTVSPNWVMEQNVNNQRTIYQSKGRI